MNIQFHKSQGSVLLVILFTVAIIGISMAAYLDLIGSQNLSTMRSTQWNSGIPVAEAGIEEALTHLHHNPTNLESQGWTLDGSYFRKERFIGTTKYLVSISNTNPPVILSRAYVRVPLGTNYMDPPRIIRVTTTNDALFAKGMVAKGQIDLSGNNIRTDSFDSSDPAYSTGGAYDPAKAKDNGDIATNSAVIDSLNVWNADIFGKASTGPGGSVTIGPNGSVGSKSWHAAGNNGIEPGWATDDMNVNFPDVQAPFSGGALTPSSGSVGGTNYDYVLTSGNWQMSDLSLSGQDKLIVLGDAVLLISNSISLSGQSYITIATNSTLKLYVAGASASLGGKGVVNTPGSATNFIYYGMPGNTSLSMSGNAAFTGAIYAPSASFTLGGGGSSIYDFVGASVTGTVRMNGHFNFHYDESLGKTGPRRGYVITSWNEI